MSLKEKEDIKILDCSKRVYADNNRGFYDAIMSHEKRVGIFYKAHILSVKDLMARPSYYSLTYYNNSYPEAFEACLREYGEYKGVLDNVYCGYATFIYIDKPYSILKPTDNVQAYGINEYGGTYVTTMQRWKFKEIYNSIDHPERFV